jgi:hypothetical protein
MSRSNRTEAQIIGLLKQLEVGRPQKTIWSTIDDHKVVILRRNWEGEKPQMKRRAKRHHFVRYIGAPFTEGLGVGIYAALYGDSMPSYKVRFVKSSKPSARWQETGHGLPILVLGSVEPCAYRLCINIKRILAIP